MPTLAGARVLLVLSFVWGVSAASPYQSSSVPRARSASVQPRRPPPGYAPASPYSPHSQADWGPREFRYENVGAQYAEHYPERAASPWGPGFGHEGHHDHREPPFEDQAEEVSLFTQNPRALRP